MLKFWAFIYRRTGYMHSSLIIDEYNYLLDNIDYIEEKYLEVLKEGPDEEGYMWSLDNIVGLEIGMYQAKHNITVNHKHMIWGDEPLNEKIWITLRRLFNL